MNKPTCNQLFDEQLKSIEMTTFPGWRHGTEREEIFYREEDNTYWCANYRVSTDGEIHELRDGDATIYKVRPVKVEKIDYVKDE